MYLREVLENNCDLPQGLQSYANVHRSFGDVSTQTIWSDVNYLVISFILVYIFVQVMLGKFNRVEQRVSGYFTVYIKVSDCFTD